MANVTDTVRKLTEAINAGKLEDAIALYEPNATMVAQPGGQLACGTAALREALARFIALKPVLTSHAEHVVEASDVALFLSRWTLRGTDPIGKEVTMSGESTDVLRKQNDRWLIAIDNPWGVATLYAR
jgi:ketosteroid isomerase-like protein